MLPPELVIHQVVSWAEETASVFIANYLPVLLAVLLQILWTAVYANIKMIEPFIHLGSTNGSQADESLFSYFLSSSLDLSSIKGILKGRWLLLWTSLTYMVVQIIGPISSELLFLDSDYDCSNRDDRDVMHPCWPPQIAANPSVLRTLQALLSFAAIMTMSILVMLWFSNTAVSENPSSLAAIAQLSKHATVRADFRAVDPDADKNEIRTHFKHKRYRLDRYRNAENEWEYGIVPHSVGNESVPFLAPNVDVQEPWAGQQKTKTRVWDVVMDSVFTAILLTILGVVVAYYKEAGDTSFNRFFNSNQFGPRFVMTAVGAVIASNWRRLERCKCSRQNFERELDHENAERRARHAHAGDLPTARPERCRQRIHGQVLPSKHPFHFFLCATS